MLVYNESELRLAIREAKPGDRIKIANGVWHDLHIEINSAATEELPITVSAETPGQVTLTGRSGLSLNRPHLVVRGLNFQGGTLPDGCTAVIEFNSDHCSVIHTAVRHCNPEHIHERYYWAFFRGGHNRLSYCRFEGKNHMEPVVGNARSDQTKYNTVDHCHFLDIKHTVPNGMEVLRIWGYGGNDETGCDGAFFTIEHNLFEHADGDDEVISLKSNYNVVRNNTILESRGGIVARSGHYNTIVDNVIIGHYYPDSTGIRVSGEGHRVTGNWIQEVESGALRLTAGEYVFDEQFRPYYLTPDFEPLARHGTAHGYVVHYGWVRGGQFAENTFVRNGGVDIELGTFYKNHWPRYQMILLPEGNQVTRNIICKPTGGKVIHCIQRDLAPPLEGFHFMPNCFADNEVYGSALEPIIEIGFRCSSWPCEMGIDPVMISKTDQTGPAWLSNE